MPIAPARPPTDRVHGVNAVQWMESTRVGMLGGSYPRFVTPPLPYGGCMTRDEYYEWWESTYA